MNEIVQHISKEVRDFGLFLEALIVAGTMTGLGFVVLIAFLCSLWQAVLTKNVIER